VSIVMIYGVKDTVVVYKYVKKTLLEMGFIWVWVLDTYTPTLYMLPDTCYIGHLHTARLKAS
jgi:hypothetical protein